MLCCYTELHIPMGCNMIFDFTAEIWTLELQASHCVGHRHVMMNLLDHLGGGGGGIGS